MFAVDWEIGDQGDRETAIELVTNSKYFFSLVQPISLIATSQHSCT